MRMTPDASGRSRIIVMSSFKISWDVASKNALVMSIHVCRKVATDFSGKWGIICLQVRFSLFNRQSALLSLGASKESPFEMYSVFWDFAQYLMNFVTWKTSNTPSNYGCVIYTVHFGGDGYCRDGQFGIVVWLMVSSRRTWLITQSALRALAEPWPVMRNTQWAPPGQGASILENQVCISTYTQICCPRYEIKSTASACDMFQDRHESHTSPITSRIIQYQPEW